MLKRIPGLKLVDLKEADWCCGSAGIYNITNQELASTLLERKMQNIIATGASVIATGNPGCMMQIALGARARGLDLQVVHPIQLLDEAYRAGNHYNLPVADTRDRRLRQGALLAGLGIGILIGLFIAGRKRKRR